MKQRGSQPAASVAWFKLAELISRGEKEKALSLYRLLAHSFEERAYILQLEGDILWAFEDGEAIERYKQAAFLYQKEHKITSAIAVYEHLLTLQPKSSEFLSQILLLYAQLDWSDKHSFAAKFKFYLKSLFDLFEDGGVSQDDVWETMRGIADSAKVKNDGSGLCKATKILLKKRASHLSKKVESMLF